MPNKRSVSDASFVKECANAILRHWPMLFAFNGNIPLDSLGITRRLCSGAATFCANYDYVTAFLQRTFKTFPCTFSSGIEYRALHFSQENFILNY